MVLGPSKRRSEGVVRDTVVMTRPTLVSYPVDIGVLHPIEGRRGS
jgi:hypothetical protein